MLKIAGVKSEKEFYKKFPTEESFLAKHGKELRKAQIGSYIGGEQGAGFQPIAFQDVRDNVDYALTGSTEQQRKEDAYRKAELSAAQKQDGSGQGLGNLASSIGQIGEIASKIGGAKKGKKISKAQGGWHAEWEMSPMQEDDAYLEDLDAMNVAANPMGMPSMNIPGSAKGAKASALAKQIGKYAPAAGQLVQGIQAAKEEKKMLQQAEQAKAVSDISLQAARIRPEQTERRYLRPEQITNTGEEFFPIYGVGTNVLAKNGASVGGGEIMNTFAPNTLYDDLGYEPLNESQRYKQFYHGGKMHKAKDGFLTQFANAGGGDAASQLMTGITGRDSGGMIGGAIGKTAGTIIGGPVGGMIGQVGGQLIGSLVNRKPEKIKEAKEATQKNVDLMTLQQSIPGAQAQYTSFMKDGGMTTSPYEWVSHTWQPQVITTFGEHKVKDLLKPPADADMLRAGGHLKEYTPPSAAAMSTERPDFQMGGELQIHWGGGAEPMSYNPYLPEGGETIMFKGQSHDESDGKGNTGIGITYGDNPVEVERGEPAMKLRDGSTGDSSLVVFGNLKIPKLLPEGEGKSFKKYVEELSKTEDKQNKLVDKSITAIDEMEVQTPFDRLKFNSLQASVMGANQKLKDIAQKKMDAAALQSAMNDTIEEYGLKTTDKGNIMAKLGKNILKAQIGRTVTGTSSLPIPGAKLEGITFDPMRGVTLFEYAKSLPEVVVKAAKKAAASKTPAVNKATSAAAKSAAIAADVPRKELYDYVSPVGKMPTGLFKPAEGISRQFMLDNPPPAVQTSTGKEKGSSPWIDLTKQLFNQVLPFVRPSDVRPLDPSQLYGEMYALATNQLEPVQAQQFQPQLTTPYEISLQDQLNENEATFRAQQRLFGYNPAVQAQLAAGKYSANRQVLGEQFRANQALRNQVYKENRELLDRAKLQNLALLDQQYTRQAEAKSKTKATTQAALNSVAAKYAQNQLENRTLQAYENLYNYRFDARGRAVNMNPLVDFEAMIANASPSQLAEYRKTLETKSKKSSESSAKNGSIVKALKNI